MSGDAPFIDGARRLELEDKEYGGDVLWSMLTVVSATCFECCARVGKKADSLGVLACGSCRRGQRGGRRLVTSELHWLQKKSRSKKRRTAQESSGIGKRRA
jgi:hypothetical protein